MSTDNLGVVNKLEPLCDEDDSNDVNNMQLTESQKPRRVRKSTAGMRKVQYEWKDDEIVRLIAAVEKRRALWDYNSPEYKLSKLESWREVVNELGFEGIDVNEVKTKWSSLRVTFKTNLAKMQKRKTGASGSSTVAWRHFKQMRFLEANNVRQANLSTSTMDVVLDDFQDSNSSQPTVSPRLEHQYAKGTRKPTPTPPPSPLPSTSSRAVTALPTVNDSNSTFCDHLLSELRTLPDAKARSLRRLLASTMYDFMDVCDAD